MRQKKATAASVYRKNVDVLIAARGRLERRRRSNPYFSLYSHLYLSGEIEMAEVPEPYRPSVRRYEKTMTRRTARFTEPQHPQEKVKPIVAPDARGRRSTGSGADSAQ